MEATKWKAPIHGSVEVEFPLERYLKIKMLCTKSVSFDGGAPPPRLRRRKPKACCAFGTFN